MIDLAKRESDSEIGGGRAFPRGESAVADAPAYVPPRRAKRATSQRDYDDDAMTSADLAAAMREQNQAPPRPPTESEPSARPGSYLEYALRAGLPRKGGTEAPTEVPTEAPTRAAEPPSRDSGFDIQPVPTKILDAALTFPEEKSGFDIQPVPTKILDAALRFDSESDAKATIPPPAAALPPVRPPQKASLPPPGTPRAELPKLALGDAPTKPKELPRSQPPPRAESEFDYSSLALDNDASNRLALDNDASSRLALDDDASGRLAAPVAPRANSALERALRDSMSSIDVSLDDESGSLDDESGDFGPAIAPLRTMQLAERSPSISDGDVERSELPILQLAVYENAANIAAATAAISAAGHAITVSTSEREGLERIGIAMTDGHIDAVLVGIPGGEVLIKAALSMAPWGPIVIASCTGSASEATRQANAAGADLVAIRPHDANRLGPVLLAAARILEQRRDLLAAQQGREEDLLSRLGSEAESDEVGGLLGFEAFQRALELELKRVRRYQYPLTLALFSLDIASTQPPPAGIKGILRARAGNALLHSIRDIDMATELDQDRFLVLLPYTDLSGATEVARRIIHAVGAIAPVVAAGGEFQPKLVGAIAGAKPGQQLSFGKLIRDAQRALEAARRDGAELAVQP